MALAAARAPQAGSATARYRLRSKIAGVVRACVDRLEGRCLLSAGGLDASFGTNGYVLTSIHAAAGANGNDGTDTASAATDNATGKLIVAGSADGNAGFAAVRYNANGSRDVTFGQGGQAVFDYGPGQLVMATSVAVQPDEHILIAGAAAAQDGNLSAVITRLTKNGQVDSAFGDNGVLTAGVDATSFAYSAVVKVAVEPDGGIVAAGRAGNADETNEDWVVWRFASDGQPDTSFGTNGSTVIDLGGLDEPLDMALTPDGKIVVAGTSQRADQPDDPLQHSGFWLVRLTSDGLPDLTFGDNGIVQEQLSQPTFAARVAFGTDGRLLVAGPIVTSSTQAATTPKIAVSRFNANGTVDTSFGSGGYTITAGISIVLGLKVANDSSAILAGYAPVLNAAGKESGTATLFAHYLPNGQPDTRYASKGVVSIRHSSSSRLNRNALFQPDGTVVLVGAGKTYSQQGKSVYGFLSARFKPDHSDSKAGSITVVAPDPQLWAKVASGGVLNIRGTSEADTILLTMVSGRDPAVRVVVNSVAKIVSLKGVKSIRIDGLAGNDYISVGDVKLACEVHGSDGDDTIVGGPGPSRLFGENGNDLLISGSSGRDTLTGGAGDDVFQAGSNGGIVDGGSGTDRVDHSVSAYKFTQVMNVEWR